MERRAFNRVLFNATAHIDVENQQHTVNLVDLSFKGALFSCLSLPDELPSQPLRLTITLDEHSPAISMQGHICHRESDKVALVCNHMDIDSATQLRRLIELNLADEDLLQRDIQALVN